VKTTLVLKIELFELPILRDISSLKAHIHIWIPDYAITTAGIQLFLRFLIRAVCNFFLMHSCRRLRKSDN
jgi:hypothetical protein